MKFLHAFAWSPEPPEKNSGELLVETAGYISTQQRVEQLILAGQRLDDFRSLHYDSDSEDFDDETFYDPTRHPSYDLADASTHLQGLRENFDRTIMEQAENSQPGMQKVAERKAKDSDNSVKSDPVE